MSIKKTFKNLLYLVSFNTPDQVLMTSQLSKFDHPEVFSGKGF